MSSRKTDAAEAGSKPRVVTTRTVLRMKESGEKIAMLTAYVRHRHEGLH